ncbi:AMP-binding enzyme family protein [Methyloversatilis sp. RAC08]|uniref:AMP-binding protein n=1 Tax=Methyloversatilis sp. RAC08 TaxID=1842540 RepID=UPI0008581B96|nr:AMP-binding protein [Methyloversatilis sp. RAC08]AOF83287.1 AMP-binding enzyme family protein [Methyloversatilis sp. RAC08]
MPATFHSPAQIHRVFDAPQPSSADLPALLDINGNSVSHAALSARMRRLASRLNEAGIGTADRVAVIAPNSTDMASALLGVMHASVCAPLNPGYRQAELEFFLHDLEARALVVTPDSPPLARAIAAQRGVPVIEAGPSLWDAAEPAPERPRTLPRNDDIALVLHTSGTTSRPKQVPLSHANLAASMANIVASLRLTQADRALNVMPLFHIHGLMAGLLAPLAGGGSVVCAPSLQLPAFFEWLERFGATWYSAVPTMHQAIIGATASGSIRQPSAPLLRFIRSSSAALAPATLAQLETWFACPVLEAYGMTEATHQMASNPLPPAQRKPGSVGLPAGPEMAILSAHGVPLPSGECGEIAIRGDNVMRAYHANPEANLAAFTNGWFRTGDEGCFDADGYLRITGRLKEMINRGGEKIAPREIDEALLAHPEVKEAVAFALPHPTLGEDLAAAVVLHPGSTVGPDTLREFLFGCLAGFKVPSEIILLLEIPKGPTGKVQRIGMAERLGAARQHAFVAPRDAIEAILAQVWNEVLEVDVIGMDDNFFALGCDSLKATRAAARIASMLPIELSATDIFHQPTAAGLARTICDRLGPDVIAEVERILDEITPVPD